MDHDFLSVGSLSLSVTTADQVVVGLLGDTPGVVGLALGCSGEFVMVECDPARARKIAASLLNKADAVECI